MDYPKLDVLKINSDGFDFHIIFTEYHTQITSDISGKLDGNI